MDCGFTCLRVEEAPVPVLVTVLTSVGDPRQFGADPYLWLMYPDPNPDPTPFFSAFKDANKSYFFTLES
jgi:hypothetical protein